jgi:hypothetical protein
MRSGERQRGTRPAVLASRRAALAIDDYRCDYGWHAPDAALGPQPLAPGVGTRDSLDALAYPVTSISFVGTADAERGPSAALRDVHACAGGPVVAISVDDGVAGDRQWEPGTDQNRAHPQRRGVACP